jgi:hypothetical protein
MVFGMSIAYVSRGTIHLNPKGVEFSLPLDPRFYKIYQKKLHKFSNYPIGIGDKYFG